MWRETTRQTKLLADTWDSSAPKDLATHINALTLAVISLAGFGRKIDLAQNQGRDIPAGYKISFLEALGLTTKFMLQILVFPSWLLSLTPYAKAALGKTQLERYMQEMIRNEKKSLETGQSSQIGPRGNLLKSIMSASHFNARTVAPGKGEDRLRREFSEDEVMGNLFIYLLAGEYYCPPSQSCLERGFLTRSRL